MLTYKKILTFLNANVDLLYSILEICQIPVTFRLSDEQQDSFTYLFIYVHQNNFLSVCQCLDNLKIITSHCNGKIIT